MKLRSFSRFWAIILGTSLLVVGLLIAWFVSLMLTGREVEDAFNRQQLLLAEGAAAGVEGAFVDLQADLSALARLPEVEALDEQTARPALSRALTELSSDGVSEIGLLDETGTARVFVARPDLERVDYSWRRYFREAADLSPGTDALVVELDTPGGLLPVLVTHYSWRFEHGHVREAQSVAANPGHRNTSWTARPPKLRHNRPAVCLQARSSSSAAYCS